MQTLAWVGAALAGLVVLGAILGPQDKAVSGAAASGRVAGVMPKDDALGLGDSDAIHQLRVSGVYCEWDGDHVHLHARFVNGLDAHVTVHVTPTYHLANAGEHGDGQDLSVGIDPGGSRVWDGDLGHPAGVESSGIPITTCSPSVSEVDLG